MYLKVELEKIKPDGAVTATVPIDGSHWLFDAERYYVSDAVEKRKNEFAAGRAAARSALRKIGLEAKPILRADDRTPIWPSDAVGSISHAEGFAVALVGRAEHAAGLGVDIEDAAPLKENIRKHVLTTRELLELEEEPIVANSARCKVTFVAKEALFKSIYPLTHKPFGFLDARIELREDQNWTVTVSRAATGLASEYEIGQGKWATCGNLIIATISVRHSPNPWAVDV